MLAVRRTDVGELNLRARGHMTAAEWLRGQPLTVPVSPYVERSFAVGDLVVVPRNDYAHGLINGERGVVTAVDVDREEVTELRAATRAGASAIPAGRRARPRLRVDRPRLRG